jgi:flagellar hook assembly protein FlgD
LNDYYTAALDSYQSGEVNYRFPALEKGKHKLTVKVWDVNNNSSEKSIDFIVQEKAEMALDHVLNYPNPFTTKTLFYFEHNQVCSQLETQIQIFTVSGRLVRTLNQIVNTEGFRSQGIEWDGRDDFGDQLAKGVYVYNLRVNSPDGTNAEKTEKLVLLK